MASVRDIKIDKVLLVLCLAYYVMKRAEIDTLWLSRIKIWGAGFTSIFSVFSVMAGWIAEILFMLLLAYIAV